MAIVDLNQLAAPDVVEVLDYETILSERKATLVSLYPEEQQEAVARTLMLESAPIVKLLEENAYRSCWFSRYNVGRNGECHCLCARCCYLAGCGCGCGICGWGAAYP